MLLVGDQTTRINRKVLFTSYLQIILICHRKPAEINAYLGVLHIGKGNAHNNHAARICICEVQALGHLFMPGHSACVWRPSSCRDFVDRKDMSFQ